MWQGQIKMHAAAAAFAVALLHVKFNIAPYQWIFFDQITCNY